MAYLVNLQLTEYGETEVFQQALVTARQEGSIPDVILFLEHQSVITVGRAGGIENLILSQKELNSRGIQVYRTGRGGNITYHGPGQLVIYPIINLTEHKCDLHWYVRRLEQAVINYLADHNIIGTTVQGRTGVWVGNEKIAAIGIAIRRWITYHGLALNVNTDLTNFNYIIPCGLKDYGVTSMECLLGKQISLKEVRYNLARHLDKLLSLNLTEISEMELKKLV